MRAHIYIRLRFLYPSFPSCPTNTEIHHYNGLNTDTAPNKAFNDIQNTVPKWLRNPCRMGFPRAGRSPNGSQVKRYIKTVSSTLLYLDRALSAALVGLHAVSPRYSNRLAQFHCMALPFKRGPMGGRLGTRAHLGTVIDVEGTKWIWQQMTCTA
jgi:hypothetical protein